MNSSFLYYVSDIFSFLSQYFVCVCQRDKTEDSLRLAKNIRIRALFLALSRLASFHCIGYTNNQGISYNHMLVGTELLFVDINDAYKQHDINDD
jgi:hypothetical protein